MISDNPEGLPIIGRGGWKVLLQVTVKQLFKLAAAQPLPMPKGYGIDTLPHLSGHPGNAMEIPEVVADSATTLKVMNRRMNASFMVGNLVLTSCRAIFLTYQLRQCYLIFLHCYLIVYPRLDRPWILRLVLMYDILFTVDLYNCGSTISLVTAMHTQVCLRKINNFVGEISVEWDTST